MAEFYCLCGKRNENRGKFADRVNSYKVKEDHPEFIDCLKRATVILEDPALCIKTGASQIAPDGSPAFPNIDLYKCRNCGAEFTVRMAGRSERP